MILLDTNVVSEPLKSKPSPRVIERLDRQAAGTLYLSAITCAELRFGVLRIADGKRRNELAVKVSQVLDLFSIAPDFDLQVMANGQSLTHITSSVLQGMDHVMASYRPDRVLVHGDTTTTMAASLAAFYHARHGQDDRPHPLAGVHVRR